MCSLREFGDIGQYKQWLEINDEDGGLIEWNCDCIFGSIGRFSKKYYGEDKRCWHIRRFIELKMEKVNCAECGKVKEVFPSRLIFIKNHFCDLFCRGKWDSKNKRGKNHSSRMEGKNKEKHKCQDCNELVDFRALRCNSCKTKGHLHPCWKGGIKENNGYIQVKAPNHPHRNKNNRVAEHRLVVEKKIGRYLTKDEQVHHIDFCKTNNKIGNLMIFKNGSDHSKFHRRLDQFGMTTIMKKQIKNRWKEFTTK